MRYVSSAITCTICLVAIFSITGCSEDTYEHATSADVLQFSVSVNDTKLISADEQAKESKAVGSAKRVEGVTDSLFISPLYESTFRGGVAQQSKKAEKAETRGTQLSDPSAITSMGISCYKGNDVVFENYQSSRNTAKNFMLANNEVNMPQDGKVTFYAYQPYNTNGVEYVSNNTFKYTAPDAIASQPDVLYAINDYSFSNNDKVVNLKFNHALTAVRFVVGDELLSGTITRITLKNIRYIGTFNIPSKTWTVDETDANKKTFTLSGLSKLTSNVTLTDNGEYFMMVPQTLPADAAIEVEYSSPLQPAKTFTIGLSGTWSAGTTLTYAIGSSSVKVLTVKANFPTKLSDGTAYPVTAYQSGDQIGLYVLDSNNKVILANYPMKFSSNSGSTATFVSTAGETLIRRNGYHYFTYYPYKASATGLPAINTTSATTDAASFFSSAITNWPITTTQSTLAGMQVNDLQVGSGSETTTGTNAATVTFSPLHQMCMIGVNKMDYYLTTDKNYKFSALCTLSSTEGPQAYRNNGYYYYLMQPSTSVKFVIKEPEYNNTDGSITSQASRNTYKELKPQLPYTIRIGDFYYASGALSHVGVNPFSSDTPVGLVMSLTTSTTDKGHGWTHGYVISAGNAGFYKWGPDGTSPVAYISDYTTGYNNKDGYTESHLLYTKGTTYPAAYHAINYKAKDKQGNQTINVNSKCSGWYLPSSGQLYDLIVNLAGFPDWHSANNYYPYDGVQWPGGTTSASNFCEAINKKYRTIKDAGYYADEIPYGDYNCFYLSSTPWNSAVVWVIEPFFGTDNLWYPSINGDVYDSKYTEMGTRPALAF